MEDFVILKAGYDQAIQDAFLKLKDLDNYDIIRYRLNKMKESFGKDKASYKGIMYKFYDKESNTGYIIFDDNFSTKGVIIDISSKEKELITESECIYLIEKMKYAFKKEFDNIEDFNNEKRAVL